MFFFPGRRVVVSLSDGSAVAGVTAWAWFGWLRLRNVSSKGGEFPGEYLIPKHAVVGVQVVPADG